MQPVSAAFLEALKASHTPTVRVDAWYDGELLERGLPVRPGVSVSFDASRTVQGQITNLQVADPDGRFEPRSETAALAPYGSRLQVVAGIEGFAEVVSVGWFRVTRSFSRQQWHPYTLKDGSLEWVTRGGVVDVDADDLMWQVDAERLMAPESPPPGATVLGEVARLLQGIIPLGSTAGVADRPVPATVVYNDSRSKAVVDLLAVLDAAPRMSPAGALDVVPRTPGGSVWEIAVGDGGALVDASTELRADDLPNAAVSSGTDVNNLPVQGTALEGAGALRFGGPHGRIPTFHASPLIDSTGMAQVDAQTVLANALASRSQTLAVVCLPNPALQLFDTVTLRTPLGSLDGQVRVMSYPLSAGLMTLTVSVPRSSYLALWGNNQGLS